MSSGPGGRTVQPKGRVLRRLVALILVGFIVIVAVGSVFLAEGDKPAGVFLIVVGVLFGGFYLALVLVWGVLRDPAAGGELTGRIVSRMPPGGASWSADRQAWIWVGGCNVPGRLGRVTASMPLAVLELSGVAISDVALTLRLRPKALAGMFGVGSFTWTASDLVGIYPVRGRWVHFNRALGIESAVGVCYFGTRQRESVLAALEQQGFPVSWAERFIKFSLV